ncbi:D-2-hydroxyacid dehydrogenase [Natronolimnobius sp. AArcel1]|uniref:D-2-hydroxyacid dehydrogenase n=1 Tax=Natronolimnobius sp. AArcel1 TaxID=1679093 RepID=UPI0013ED9FE1|nr:D-2-hydroxyacid dehydrogenase [Natronolimnobius sp. AArcel1]NGM68751.1 D-2-hydroxyacid dehydrogenase [Natronolimnobius sp. AArcel1]
MSAQPTVLVTDYVARETATKLVDHLESALPDGVVERATIPEETRDLIEDANIVVTNRLPAELLERAQNLRWVHALSSGVDSYPLEELEEREIVLTNSAGIHAQPIAEQVLCYMLMFERGLTESVRQQRQSVWERVTAGELHGQTVGVIGVGAIGERVAELCAAFGMEVLGTKRDLEDVPDAVDEIYAADDHHEVLARADYVVLACPLTDETQGLIGERELHVMGRNSVLVNIGRGELADEDALVESLQQGRIRGAGLDVFETEPLPRESPLWDLSNVVITPHMAGSTPHRFDRWLEILEPNYEAVSEGRLEEMENRVV